VLRITQPFWLQLCLGLLFQLDDVRSVCMRITVQVQGAAHAQLQLLHAQLSVCSAFQQCRLVSVMQPLFC
jgi:hypothetical protein